MPHVDYSNSSTVPKRDLRSRSSYKQTNQTRSSKPTSDQNEPVYYKQNSSDQLDETIEISGDLAILGEYGVIALNKEFLADKDIGFPTGAYVSLSQIRRFNLRKGDTITGLARLPKENERFLSLLKIEKVMGMDPEKAAERPVFEKRTPIFPNFWLSLESKSEKTINRLIDLFAPVGKGQRGMIVAPPKAGKTWLLKDIANGITDNYPEIALMVALIGERPEEVTDMSRSVKGEIFSSNFDEPAENHVRTAELCLEKAKRLAETGSDVVILMDSITRLARAYNNVVPPSGRTLSGGVDPVALYPPKHFFGAARNFEEGGSLTILATALVDTGSKMDDLIYEEFKGTGNMELHLDRSLAERRIFPAIDIIRSGTRHEELLFDKKTYEKVAVLRRMVDMLDKNDATSIVVDRLKKTATNKDFLETLQNGK